MEHDKTPGELPDITDQESVLRWLAALPAPHPEDVADTLIAIDEAILEMTRKTALDTALGLGLKHNPTKDPKEDLGNT